MCNAKPITFYFSIVKLTLKVSKMYFKRFNDFNRERGCKHYH